MHHKHQNSCSYAQNPVDDALTTVKAVISLKNLAHNYVAIKQYCQKLDEQAIVTAVVKANAYGIGMMKAARTFYQSGCRHFFVATLNEAIRLRHHMNDVEIFVLNGLNFDAMESYVENRLIPCLGNVDAVRAWVAHGQKIDQQLPAILHFDTGIHRLGMDIDAYNALDMSVKNKLNIHHIMSHFASADVADDAQNIDQIDTFSAIYKHFEGENRSFGNSAGISLSPLQNIALKGRNYLRPGIALYGSKPSADYPIALKQVVRLSAKVMQKLSLKKGDKIGYNHIYTCKQDLNALVISMGYADGLSRQISQSEQSIDNYFGYKGQKLPIMGRVSMDMTVVDASAIHMDQIKIGDYVEIFGDDIHLNDHAQMCNTISYEILCSMTARVTKQYIKMDES